LLKTTAAATGALALPFVHGAHAAGKLSAFFWDHPVPSVPPAMRKLCEAWAAKEKIDLQLDFVSTNGDKILLTVAAEGQARSGHDIATIPSWYVSGQADRLEPVDDLIPPLVEQNASSTGRRNISASSTAIGRRCRSRRAADLAGLRPHRSDEAACRDRHHPDVPGGGPPNQGWRHWNWTPSDRRGQAGRHPFGLPLGCRRIGGLGRRVSPATAPSWSTATATSRSIPTR
jgi:hypothetical protein